MLDSIWENHTDIQSHLQFSISGNIFHIIISGGLCEQHFSNLVSVQKLLFLLFSINFFFGKIKQETPFEGLQSKTEYTCVVSRAAKYFLLRSLEMTCLLVTN